MGTAPTFRSLEDEFDRDIDSRREEIDSERTLDWLSVILGWAIAKGMSTRDAKDFAVAVRYKNSRT